MQLKALCAKTDCVVFSEGEPSCDSWSWQKTELKIQVVVVQLVWLRGSTPSGAEAKASGAEAKASGAEAKARSRDSGQSFHELLRLKTSSCKGFGAQGILETAQVCRLVSQDQMWQGTQKTPNR